MIRPYQPDDLAALTAICNYYIRTSTATFEVDEITLVDFEQRLAECVAPILVVQDPDSGLIQGYAYAHPWKSRPCYWPTLELTVYLHPDCRGRGLGRCLISRLIQALREQQRYRVLLACITASNTSSVRLFSSLGFSQASYFENVGEKFGTPLSVVDLTLAL